MSAAAADVVVEAVPVPPPSADEIRYEPEAVVGYVRSPSDLLRLIVFALLSVGLFLLTRFARDAIVGFEKDLVGLFGFLNTPAQRILAGATTVLLVVVGLGVYVPPILMKRYRLLGYIVLANLLTAALVALARWGLNVKEVEEATNQILQGSNVDVSDSARPESLAQLAAAFVILGPFVSHRWRRAGLVLVSVITFLALVLSMTLPAELFLALAIGAMVGAGVLLLLGRPDQRPTLAAVRAGLVSSGLDVVELKKASVDARGSSPYFATLADGSRLFAKALSPQERSADLVFRFYRYLRLKNVGDERPFSSLRRTVEHEALVAHHARDLGVRTPRLRCIAAIGSDSMLLAYDLIEGTSLDRVDALSDETLRELWEQVAVMRRGRIAHRDLRRANIFQDAQAEPWIIDFGFSEVAADQGLLDADIAQLLAALSIAVGPDRAVDSAVSVIGPEAVGSSLRFLQPNALSGATRAALKERTGLLKELQQTVIDRCQIAAPQYEALERLNAKTLFTLVLLAAVVYFLLPQLADLPGIIKQIGNANWAWAVPLVIASALTYVGASVSALGSVPSRLRALPTFITQVASSFCSKLAPASVGGMALNVRYFQKAGVDPPVAVSAVGVNAVAGFAGHITLMLLFVLWAGRDAFGSLKLPDPKWAIIGVVAVAVVAIVSFAIPKIRQIILTRLVPILKRSVGGVAAIARRPGKLAMLLGGSLFVTFTYIVTFAFALLAFGGGDLSFAQIGAIYLTGSAVATAAPTPGGLGALEAALIAGLVAAGVDNTVAVPAVFLYRLATFWLPILPGWFSFEYLRREEYV